MDISGIRYAPQIEAAAAAHGLDPKLLAAVAAQETGGPGANSGSNIVGDAGHGHGVFQIDDRSWNFAKTSAAMDPAKNADMAASILADNLQRYGGNVHEALSAYNSGKPDATGTTTTWGDGTTLGYADSVLRHYADLGGDTASNLLAERGETSSNVNALSAYAASSSGVRAASSPGTATATPSAGAQVPVMPPLMPSFTPAPPMQYASSGQQAVSQIGSEGDKLLGDLVDASDDDSPDSTESA